MSVESPQWVACKGPSDDCKMYQIPFEGRHTATSVLPSPSKSGWPRFGPMETTYGRIISLSSCSTIWQCQTYRPGISNLARTVVISPDR